MWKGQTIGANVLKTQGGIGSLGSNIAFSGKQDGFLSPVVASVDERGGHRGPAKALSAQWWWCPYAADLDNPYAAGALNGNVEGTCRHYLVIVFNDPCPSFSYLPQNGLATALN